MGIMSLRRQILMAQPHLESVTGANGIATFDTDFVAPVNKITIPFSPVQSLNGYSNPWPPGASVNRIPDGTDTSNGYVATANLSADGSISSNADCYVSEYFPMTAGETYTWSGPTIMNASCICFYDENKTFISSIQAERLLPKTFVAPEGTVYCRATQYIVFVSTGNSCQIQTGSTATTPRVPYSNVCPISGATGCEIGHSGKNLVTSSNYLHATVNSSGKCVSSSTYDIALAPVQSGQKYRIDGETSDSVESIYGFFTSLPAINSFTYNRSRTVYTIATTDVITAPITGWIAVRTMQNNRTVSVEFANTLSIDWQTEAGTVYGGSVTLNEDGSADLVMNWRNTLTIDGTQNWSLSSTNRWLLTPGIQPYYVRTSAAYIKCDKLKSIAAGSLGANSNNMCFVASLTQIGVAFTGISHTNAALKAWLTENPITLTYYMKTPQTYHFDNIGALHAFLGKNHIWSYINGSPTVTFWKHG